MNSSEKEEHKWAKMGSSFSFNIDVVTSVDMQKLTKIMALYDAIVGTKLVRH